ncbi:MAG: hypothetical protein GX230_07625 [Lentisphaerae bacterium]|nr:hypothetical protein [Lentisphaerota bacterium]
MNTATQKTTIINLDDVQPFGMGGRRLCFVHPENPSRCIKVLRTDENRVIRWRKSKIPAKWRRAYDNNAHEKKELERLYRKLGDEMSRHFPRSYGMITTSIGPGLELDLMRDDDGLISKDIRSLLLAGYPLAQLRDVFNQFGEFLLRHRILTRNLLDHNLVVSMRDGKPYRIYMIDGMGDPAWLPLARWIPALGTEKVKRRMKTAWTRFQIRSAEKSV